MLKIAIGNQKQKFKPATAQVTFQVIKATHSENIYSICDSAYKYYAYPGED